MSDQVEQLGEEDVRRMSPGQISEARKAGALRAYLAGESDDVEFTVPEGEGVPGAGSTHASYRAYLRSLTPHELVDARRTGKLPSEDGSLT